MKNILSIALVSLMCLTAQAQWGSSKKINGNGNVTTEKRSTSNYDQISLRGNMDVTLVAGNEGNITITAESNFMEYLITKVENDKLILKVKKGYNLRTSRGKKIQITVPFKDLNAVGVSGSGDIVGKDVIKADNFKTAVSGSGDIELHIEANHVKSAVSGSGDIQLKGKANSIKCSVSGSGDIEAIGLKTKKATASIAGSGDIEVTATEEIKATVAGSGGIKYAGNPQKVDKSKAGSGSIRAY